ncbi:endonuclease/exonuclease/phosphatase family metal-dependent hydrolase [Kribbella amoyensis]|uniref:Endonuclease/exonuclease/phosphatase family metal-dependent hydrolase n=1 Tax=Kribbella amoyensis TaxID=996641 RepID=A0A561BMY7_9ACTN|nr:endonuclease/exonuclease/phosphatase family protein [Kribbella amoyensis]TWD80213.1 endonuclease/exonuclease/phosphatase family metal-dependent hydrolase [Kribbella amoyensis]
MRVLSWNLWWRFGPWEQREAAILTVLRAADADLIGLQEVWAQGHENQAELLAAELGLHWTFEPSLAPESWQRRIGDPTVAVGNAILSRPPIDEREVRRLPGAEGRFALYASTGGVPFFTAHLEAPLDASAVRCDQVRALAEFVAEHPGGHPPVVTGDFNAVPDSDELRLFSGLRTAPPVPGQVLIDAWEYAAPGEPGATWDAANPYVRRTFTPSARVDYVHVGVPRPDGGGHVTAVRRAGAEAVDGVWPSDHAAVVVDLAPVLDPAPVVVDPAPVSGN